MSPPSRLRKQPLGQEMKRQSYRQTYNATKPQTYDGHVWRTVEERPIPGNDAKAELQRLSKLNTDLFQAIDSIRQMYGDHDNGNVRALINYVILRLYHGSETGDPKWPCNGWEELEKEWSSTKPYPFD